MNCDWYAQQLGDYSVDLWPNGRPSPALLAHARECHVCALRVDSELALRESLLSLADSSRSATPSALVKDNLLAELARKAPAPAPRRMFWGFALAAAAVLCIAAVVLFWRSKAQQVPAQVAVQPSAPAPKIAALPKVQEPPKQQPPKQQPVVTAAARPRRTVSPRQTQQVAAPNDFYPVVMCDSLSCAGPMFSVRVELPRSPLVIRSGASRTVQADLLVGEDGLVRGVRVLQ